MIVEGYKMVIHPGEILDVKFRKPCGLSKAELARRLGVSRIHVHLLIQGKRRITPNLAVRLAKLFNTEPQLWLNLQAEYDLYSLEDKDFPEITPCSKGELDV